MSNLKPVIENSMIAYAGAVLQSRALVDVRDAIKPSARQIFYALYTDKFLSSKPYKKSLKAVGSLSRFYIHGDASAVGILMRNGQNFAMRYPLMDVHGNAGTLLNGEWAHQRYTESRLSPLCERLFDGIDKDSIEEWRDNYDDTEKYPAVLPSKGFYNIVNGTQGIAVGAASSIPQYNLKEVNNALIKLLQNPGCDFEDIYCAPDFATGAVLYNESAIKESMKNGAGAACKLRSVVLFDSKERCLVVTEIPYGVYTNTICAELEKIEEDENNPGIERHNDLTGEKPLIKIYLSKKANPDRIIKYLYKNTSLESYYGINFTMLDDGRFPKVFGWKDMLQAHINHEKVVYRREFQYDLNKIAARIHIIEGLLKCMASIEEVIQTIKSSASTAAASKNLQDKFELDEAQAKAVLDMKLSRLAHLEVEKLENEKTSLEGEKARIEDILNDTSKFNQCLIDGWNETSKKFGDARRTKIMNLESDDGEVIEERQLSLVFTNKGTVYTSETSSLYAQRRNTVGSKLKLEKDEFIVDSIVGKNTDTILFFTSHGNFYHMKMGDFNIGETQYLSSLVNMMYYEHVVAASILSNTAPHILFITKNGIIKKSSMEDYNLSRNVGATAIKLDSGDEIISVLFISEDRIGIMSENGNFIWIETKDIRPIGRVSRGVQGMKLDADDHVAAAHTIPDSTTHLMSINTEGMSKSSSIDEFRVTGRATKGVKIQKTSSPMIDFLPISSQGEIIITSTKTQIKLRTEDIPVLSRGTLGVHTLKLPENSTVLKFEKL